jgi:intracellular septation protein
MIRGFNARPELMQILFDFLPLVAFFIAYKLAGIYVATAVIIVSVFLMIAYRKLRGEKITQMQKLSAGLLLAFGGLTLILQDDRFILWKPTVFYWLVAGALLASLVMKTEPVLQKLMGDGLTLPKQSWIGMTWAWVALFAVQGGLNLFVAYNYSRDAWVMFKFVALGISMVFMFVVMLWIAMRAENLPVPSTAEATDKSGASQ